MAGTLQQSRRRGGKLDDETTALVLQLWRTPDPSGKRRSYRDIARECAQRGRPIAHTTVQRLCSQVHQETVEEAASRVREQLTEALDINVKRITEMSELLATAARTGRWPDGTELKGMVRVAAARDAIHASSQLASICGVDAPKDELNPEAIAARAKKLYGIDIEAEDDESDGERDDRAHANGNGAAPVAH